MTKKTETKIENNAKRKQKTEIKGIKSFSKNSENPFMEKTIKDIEIVKRQQIMRSGQNVIQRIIDDDGQVTGHTTFMRYIEVEEERFAKLYLSQFEAFFELPTCAIRVFLYIMTKLKNKEDKFEFLINECMEYTKYTSSQPIYNALVALCANNIIARGYNEYIYFINPMVVFNGNRVTFAKTYVKKKTENKNQLDLFKN